ncbi:ribonuclease H2, subunit C [Lipomyces doorenjongii]|uniref:ribonuclease H2, subunit C n=1 Tax=Lipomyces doorenjongii TaxID=383834 RepID=UPI0034CE4BDB
MTTQKCATLNLHTPLLSDKHIRSVTPHILPCKIHHDGPANVRRYFHVHPYKPDASRPKVSSATTSPTRITTESFTDITSTDSSAEETELKEYGMNGPDESTPSAHSLHEAYFRGRKLVGQKLVLPEGYKGLILPIAPSPSDIPAQTKSYFYSEDDDEEEDEEQEQEHMWKSEAEFKELFVWNHDVIPDGISNPWIAGVNEWISFTNRIHCEYEEGEREVKR